MRALPATRAQLVVGLSLLSVALAAFWASRVWRREPRSPLLTPAESQWLSAHPTARLAPLPNWPPVDFIDEGGSYSGFLADYMALLEKRTGLRLTIVPTRDFNDRLRLARELQVDVVTTLVRTPERERYLDFVGTYLRIPAVIVVKKDLRRSLTLPEMRGMRIEIVDGYSAQGWIREHYPYLDLRGVENDLTGLRRVSFGEADAVITDLATASYQIEREGITNLRLAGETGYVYDCDIAVRKDAPILSRVIAKGMAAISAKEKGDLYSKWIHIAQRRWWERREFWLALSLPLLAVLAVSAWSLTLKRQVTQRTREIRAELTERKRAEEGKLRLEAQLLQAQKMETVGRLAGGVAHDFNNLLTAIIGQLDLALMKAGPDSPLRDNLSESKKAAESAVNLTQQLLAFSRRQIIEPKLIDLAALIERMRKMLAPLIGEDVELGTRTGPGLGLVKMDAGQIEQIIVNLAINARDAMPDGGHLTIAAENIVVDEAFCERHALAAPGPYVRLSVSDTGIGMDDAVKAHLFEPFFTTKPVGKGTGLGLATVYGAVRQNGGAIDVESAPGKGTTFSLYLPRRLEGDAPPLEGRGEAAVRRGTETILLVEDNAQVLEATLGMLRALGYHVLTASDGPQALELSRGHAGTIDLLLTDVVMPGMNGRELADRLAAERPCMKVLFLSGYTDDVAIVEGVQNAGIHFIAKPFTLRELAARLREILDPAGRRHDAPRG